MDDVGKLWILGRLAYTVILDATDLQETLHPRQRLGHARFT